MTQRHKKERSLFRTLDLPDWNLVFLDEAEKGRKMSPVLERSTGIREIRHTVYTLVFSWIFLVLISIEVVDNDKLRIDAGEEIRRSFQIYVTRKIQYAALGTIV